jgi:multiple antibiotic resistance protein
VTVLSLVNPAICGMLFAQAEPGISRGKQLVDARLHLPTTALVAIGVATATTWLVMLVAARIARKLAGSGFLRDTISRLMGLLVLSMGVQFALTGFHAFAP